MSKPLTQTTGRRKRAVARVRFRPGTGKITVNKREVDDYFPSETHRMIFTEPLLSGRSWQTCAVKPEKLCSFSPILSVENGMKCTCISGVASRGCVLKNAPADAAAIVSGPLRCNA